MELRRRCTLLQNGCHVYSLKLCDGYTWWRHQMETFSTLLALCEGNLPATGRSPPPPTHTHTHKVQCRGALMFIPCVSKWHSKQSIRRWFETPWHWLWSPCNLSASELYYTASEITSVSIVYSIVCSSENQRKYHSSASLAFVRRIHRWPVNFPHKGPVTRKIFPFHDVIVTNVLFSSIHIHVKCTYFCFVITYKINIIRLNLHANMQYAAHKCKFYRNSRKTLYHQPLG